MMIVVTALSQLLSTDIDAFLMVFGRMVDLQKMAFCTSCSLKFDQIFKLCLAVIVSNFYHGFVAQCQGGTVSRYIFLYQFDFNSFTDTLFNINIFGRGGYVVNQYLYLFLDDDDVSDDFIYDDIEDDFLTLIRSSSSFACHSRT